MRTGLDGNACRCRRFSLWSDSKGLRVSSYVSTFNNQDTMPPTDETSRHAHSDHYTNLSKSWNHGPIYCSHTTANLIVHMLGVEPHWVVSTWLRKSSDLVSAWSTRQYSFRDAQYRWSNSHSIGGESL